LLDFQAVRNENPENPQNPNILYFFKQEQIRPEQLPTNRKIANPIPTKSKPCLLFLPNHINLDFRGFLKY
jgi:hypothetical protein